MRIVFMGTPEFAAASLERLYAQGHDIAGVFTKPDKPRNRGMKVSYSPVKEVALAHGTDVHQPASFADGAAAQTIRMLNCDIVAVVAYGRILPRDVLELPALGCVNIHASLLPKYRGAAPVQWAILNGEKETGVTSMRMSEELDAGDIFFVKKTPIGNDETAGELLNRLGPLGAELLCETIEALSCGRAVPVPQIHSEATYAPPLEKDISLIDWSDTALNIKRKVCGLNPWPIAKAELGGTKYKIYSVDIGEREAADMKPGEVRSSRARGLEVACSDAVITIKELQAPGGKRMPAVEFLKGNRLIGEQ